MQERMYWPLIWELAEAPQPVIAGRTLHEQFGEVAQDILKQDLLQPQAASPEVLCPACDREHYLEVQCEAGEFYVLCPRTGRHTIHPEKTQHYRLAEAAWLAQVQHIVSAKGVPQTLIADVLWDLGLGRYGDRHVRVYLARRMGHNLDAVREYFRQLPGDRLGLVLSTCKRPYPDLPHGIRIVPLPQLFQQDPIESLHRLMTGPVVPSLPHAPDFSWIEWKGKVHHFRPGSAQSKIVKALYEAHQAGNPNQNTQQMLRRINLSDTTGVPKFFKGHPTWLELIEYGNPRGVCRLRP